MFNIITQLRTGYSQLNGYRHKVGSSQSNQCEVLNKLKYRGFREASLSNYDCSTLYTTLPHNLIKDRLTDLIERTFQRKCSLSILLVMIEMLSSRLKNIKSTHYGHARRPEGV